MVFPVENTHLDAFAHERNWKHQNAHGCFLLRCPKHISPATLEEGILNQMMSPFLSSCHNHGIRHPMPPTCISARASAQLLVRCCSGVASLMLFSHHFLSIHFYLCPGSHSCSILLSRWSPSPLQKCPKYSSFLLLIFPHRQPCYPSGF